MPLWAAMDDQWYAQSVRAAHYGWASAPLYDEDDTLDYIVTGDQNDDEVVVRVVDIANEEDVFEDLDLLSSGLGEEVRDHPIQRQVVIRAIRKLEDENLLF